MNDMNDMTDKVRETAFNVCQISGAHAAHSWYPSDRSVVGTVHCPGKPEADGLKYVTSLERELCWKYGDLLTNTGGNDPLELLDDLSDPTYKDFASTNLPRFILAASVSAQIGLLMRLERDGRL